MRERGFLVLLLAVSSCLPQAPSGQKPPAPSKGIAMNPQQTDPVAELLRLPDEEYFALNEDRRMDLADAFSALSEDESAADAATIRPRLGLGAPSRIDLKVRDKAPMLLASFETGLRAWKVNFLPNLHIFVKSRSTGELLYSTPLISMRRGLQPQPSGAGKPPDGPKAAMTRASVVIVDLLDRLAGRLTSGEILATAVAYDVRSNTVRIHIDGPEASGTPLAPKRPYVRSDLDERPAIESEIAVPERGSAKGGFRIRVAKQFTEEDGVLRTDLNQPFLPAHIALVQLDKPVVIIPASPLVQQVAQADGKKVFNTLFLVELGGEKGSPVTPGSYQVYLDLGTNFLGPYPLTVEE
jgi:hypothetical protein